MLVSATPGMCMTLALTLGMTIGLKRTLWMMLGELIGVAIVSVLAVVGVASVMLNYPSVFAIFKYLGGGYLAYLGVQLWLSDPILNVQQSSDKNFSPSHLAMQGFVSAIANPKGWAFTVSLLPPFINSQLPLAPQLSVLVMIILVSEFAFMILYATGGRTLKKILAGSRQVALVNRTSGSVMILVGFWLAFG